MYQLPGKQNPNPNLYPSSGKQNNNQSSRNTSGSPLTRLAFQANPFTPTQQKMGQHSHSDVEAWKRNMQNLNNLKQNQQNQQNLQNQYIQQNQQNQQNQQRTTNSIEQLDTRNIRISQLDDENKALKFQLEVASAQILQLQQKLQLSSHQQGQEQIQQQQQQQQQQQSQSLLKTTTFELVVLQKSVEQLENLKIALNKRKEKLNLNDEVEDLSKSQQQNLVAELRVRISQLEEQNVKLSKENEQFHTMHLFPERQGSKGERLGERLGRRGHNDSSEMRQVLQKGSPNYNPLISPKKNSVLVEA